MCLNNHRKSTFLKKYQYLEMCPECRSPIQCSRKRRISMLIAGLVYFRLSVSYAVSDLFVKSFVVNNAYLVQVIGLISAVSLQATFQGFIFKLAFFSTHCTYFLLQSFFNCLFASCFVRLGETRIGATIHGQVRPVQVSRSDCSATRVLCVRHTSKKIGADFLLPH